MALLCKLGIHSWVEDSSSIIDSQTRKSPGMSWDWGAKHYEHKDTCEVVRHCTRCGLVERKTVVKEWDEK